MDEYQLDKQASQINSIINGAVVSNAPTALSEAEKAQARENIGASAVGTGLKIIAHYDTLEELEAAVPSPEAGEAYSVGESVPYSLYIYDFAGNAWRDYGAIRAEDITARIVQNTVVPVSAWTQDATVFADYPYKADISLSDVTGGDFPIVVFNPTDAIAGNFCPVAYAFDGTVEIFAKTIPSAAMTVPAMTFIALSSGAVSTKGITNASGGIPSGSIGTSAIQNGAVTTDKLAANAVTRAKLADDALYSPVMSVSSSVTTLTAAGNGKTIFGAYTSSADAVRTLEITANGSASMPVGYEVAVCRLFLYPIVRVKVSGIRLVHDETWSTKTDTNYITIQKRGGMIALKKFETNANAGDTWLLTGEAEVTS